jgi:hypothetical protein
LSRCGAPKWQDVPGWALNQHGLDETLATEKARKEMNRVGCKNLK